MSEKKAVTKGSKKGLSWKKKDWIAAYIFIAPVTIGLLVFYIWPFIQNVWFSFNDVNKFNVATFNGIENYKQLVSDKEVWASLGTTLKYVVFDRFAFECEDQREIHLSNIIFPAFCNDGGSRSDGMEMDIQ